MPLSMTSLILLGLATAVSAGLSALAARAARRGAHAAPWWGGGAVGLAYLLAHSGVAMPSFPPVEVTDRIVVIALVATLVAMILAGDRGGRTGRVVGYLGLVAVSWVAMLEPVLGAAEIPRETMAWLAGTAVVSWLAALNVAWLDEADRRSELWVALTVFALGSGVVLVLANSAVLFQLGGVLALALGVSILGAWGRPVGGGVAVGVAVLTALILEGFVYAFLPGSAALTLAFGPAILWLTRMGAIARLGPKARQAIASALILMPVAIAIGLILANAPAEGEGY